jgi:membrane protein DedA with SNARE-associated domain
MSVISTYVEGNFSDVLGYNFTTYMINKLHEYQYNTKYIFIAAVIAIVLWFLLAMAHRKRRRRYYDVGSTYY